MLGSRFLGTAEGIPWTRRLILKLGIAFTRIYSQIVVSDTHNGLRAFSREAAAKIGISHAGMAHASEILDQISQQDLPYCEVPVTIVYTSGTLSKGQSSLSSVKLALQLLLGKMIR